MSTAICGASEKGWYDRPHITPNEYRDTIFASQEKAWNVGFLSNIIENHDQPRGVSNYLPEGEVNDTSKKMLATLLFMVRGIPFIYQGQEIGMENVDFTSMDQIDDVMTHDEYQVALRAGLTPEEALEAVKKMSRDNARVPFSWDASEHAGFTTGKPWLMNNPDYTRINLAAQRQDEASVYQYYRKLIQLRKNPEYKETIVWGKTVPAYTDYDNLMAFYRQNEETQGEKQRLLVIANYQKEPQSITLETDVKKVLLNNCQELKLNDRELCLEGYQAVVLEV